MGPIMKFLIFGGCGFLGSNLASEVLKRGHELVIYDNLSRLGSENNKLWLESIGSFLLLTSNIKDFNVVESTIIDFKPDVIFHTAGQVAMTTSLSNPRLDFETNALGTFNVLESVRQHSPNTAIFFSSTNKVYGDLENFHYEETPTRYICKEYPTGFDESLPLDFRTPYGCSKGAADQYVIDYNRIYNLDTIVFRLSVNLFHGLISYSTMCLSTVQDVVHQKSKPLSLREPSCCIMNHHNRNHFNFLETI
jgi:CDP-paratose 2-epimerase